MSSASVVSIHAPAMAQVAEGRVWRRRVGGQWTNAFSLKHNAAVPPHEVNEMPMVKIYREKCKGCELCNHACPQKILGMSKELNTKGYFYAVVEDGGRCIGCCMCAITCPDVAIEVGIQGTRYVLFEY